ncbi:DUF3108 domain-containing protein [Thermodesulfobacteriota bacterium]
MKKLRSGILFIVLILFVITGCLKAAMADEYKFPFNPEERMTFQVRWAFLPAGEAVLEVLPIENLSGVTTYHFVFTAKTNEFVDLIYKVRDRIDSYTDKDMTRSLMYRKQHQGKSKKDAIIYFDWERKQAQYSNFGEKREPIDIMPGTFDPLSVFFAFRLHDPNVLTEISVPVTDGKKCIVGKAKVIKRESINVAGSSYDTFLVEPELEHIRGVFQKSKNAKLQIWITADSRRIPVRIKSKVLVGSFVAELVSFEKGSVAGHAEK